MDKIEKLEGQISITKSELNNLQSQYKRLTGMSYNGMPVNIRYQFEFTYEEHFQVRFNYVPGCPGDEWTPGTPEEVEIVQVLFFGEPLTVNQERAFIEEYEDDLEDCCWQEWQKHQDDDGDWLNDCLERLVKARWSI